MHDFIIKLRQALKTSQKEHLFSRDCWKLIDHAILLTSQVTILTVNFLTYHIFGPRKPSWPIQLTLMCAAMRALTEHTHLADVDKLRKFVNVLFSLVPSDIIITPVSFRVSNRSLPGILKELEDLESGDGEISGEWIVPKDLWIKINDEYRLKASIHRHLYTDQDGTKWSKEKVILYIHGGAYYLMSAKTHRDLNYRLSKTTERRVFAINYRLAPEGPFPCGLHDTVHSFLYLTDPNGLAIQPHNVVVAGDCAGGGLVLAMLYYLRDNGMPLPGGVVLFSPWVDLTMSCASWDQNQSYDFLFNLKENDKIHPVKLYLNPYEERSNLVNHPYVSPLFGDLHDLPPILIQCGDSEVLRDEIYLLAHKASQTGTTFVQHEVYGDMVHVFQLFNYLESSVKAMDSVGSFVRMVIPIHQRSTLFTHTNKRYTPSELKLSSPSESLMPTGPHKWSFANQIPVRCDKSTCTKEDQIIFDKAPLLMYNSHFTSVPLKTSVDVWPSQQPEYFSPQNPSTPPSQFAHTHIQHNYQSTRSQPTINPLRSSAYPDLKQLYFDYNDHPAIKTNFVAANATNSEIINNESGISSFCCSDSEYDSAIDELDFEVDGEDNEDCRTHGDERSVHSVDVGVGTGDHL
ncbi:9798_t:CDS:2 [Acaulospora morrowiae]|uniref:9798_t:CDS:1 n=1 Tax=Acaulospora morrowiae TaxID=94023 RepID=A0A9N9FB33_9GLOM|nr:9798_t:CDS:2 [Acaulospora morrowiae]